MTSPSFAFSLALVRRTLLAPLMLLLLPLLGGWAGANAADIYVIAHPATKITPEAIRDVYIGEKQFAGEVKIIPVDNAAAQAEFLEKVLRLDQTRYTNLWVKKSFRDALNPPATRTSDKEIVEFVRKTPGALAYIASSPPAGVIVIQKH
jgi:hypothetical protein